MSCAWEKGSTIFSLFVLSFSILILLGFKFSAKNLDNLRQSPFYRLYNYGYYGDNNNNIHYNYNDDHTDKITLLKGSDRQCMVVKLENLFRVH